MTDIETTATEGAETGRVEKTKAALGQAGKAIRDEAQSFAAAAQARVRSEAEKGQETATKTLGDFAQAIRRAGEELSQSDQSPAARLVRQAADGLESVSRNLAGKRPEDLVNDVRGFARSHPAAFIGGAVLVGVALGRFIRASEADSPLAGATGGDHYAAGDTQPLMVGGESLGDETLSLAEEDGFDGPAEGGGGIESSIADDLGDLRPSDAKGG